MHSGFPCARLAGALPTLLRTSELESESARSVRLDGLERGFGEQCESLVFLLGCQLAGFLDFEKGWYGGLGGWADLGQRRHRRRPYFRVAVFLQRVDENRHQRFG